MLDWIRRLFGARCAHEWQTQVMAMGTPKPGEPVKGFVWAATCARCGQRQED